jgi:hypothetical protein
MANPKKECADAAGGNRAATSLCDCRIVDPCGCVVDPCTCFRTDARGCYRDCPCGRPPEAPR